MIWEKFHDHVERLDRTTRNGHVLHARRVSCSGSVGLYIDSFVHLCSKHRENNDDRTKELVWFGHTFTPARMCDTILIKPVEERLETAERKPTQARLSYSHHSAASVNVPAMFQLYRTAPARRSIVVSFRISEHMSPSRRPQRKEGLDAELESRKSRLPRLLCLI